MNLTNIVALIGVILGAFTTLGYGFAWYANVEKRKYGLERDLNHLKRNYEQIQDGLKLILREIEHRFDTNERDILEIKSTLNNHKICFKSDE